MPDMHLIRYRESPLRYSKNQQPFMEKPGMIRTPPFLFDNQFLVFHAIYMMDGQKIDTCRQIRNINGLCL